MTGLKTFGLWFLSHLLMLNFCNMSWQPTRTHYQEFTSLDPPDTNGTKSYLDQYKKVRADVME